MSQLATRPAADQDGSTGWSRDAWLVIAARALRTLGYGATSVLLAGLLADDGRSPAQLAALVAVASAGSVVASLAMGALADRYGRRRCLLISALLMATSGLAFTFVESYLVLVAAAFIGTISPSTNDNTPFSGVEQSILAQTCPDRRHTRLFTVYNVTALTAGALGGLLAAVLDRVPAMSAGDAAFAVYTLLALATAGLVLLMSPGVEPVARPARSLAGAYRGRLPRHAHWLAGLFALDAFAGGLAVQTMLAWWLHDRFDASPAQLGLLFFALNLLSAGSQLAAPLLAARHGLLATMLVPHAVSNLLLLCVPLAPNLATATVVLLARHALSKIDVPARQAFTVAIVEPVHRTAAASLTSVARSVAVCASPIACSALLIGPFGRLGAPLLLAGGLAIGYDTALWKSFRGRLVRGEAKRP